MVLVRLAISGVLLLARGGPRRLPRLLVSGPMLLLHHLLPPPLLLHPVPPVSGVLA